MNKVYQSINETLYSEAVDKPVNKWICGANGKIYLGKVNPLKSSYRSYFKYFGKLGE